MASERRDFARDFHKHPTRAEAFLGERVRGCRFHGAEFRREVPFDRFVVDFLPRAKLVVEREASSTRGSRTATPGGRRTLNGRACALSPLPLSKRERRMAGALYRLVGAAGMAQSVCPAGGRLGNAGIEFSEGCLHEDSSCFSRSSVGLVFIGLAALYWLTPAGDLPAFLPDFREGATDIHVKHALGALIIGLAALAFAWFSSRREPA